MFLDALFSNTECRDSAKAILDNIFAEPIEDKGLTLLNFLINEADNYQLMSYARERMSLLIEGYNLDAEKTMKAWLFDGANKETSIRLNIEALRDLELSKPGICAFLQKNFGISDFRRYPKQILLDQMDRFEDQETQHGILLMPIADHNGAFSQDLQVFDKFYQQIKDKYNLRVYECGNIKDLAKSFIHTKNRYAPKLSFAIVGGHGTKDSIQLGNFFVSPNIPADLETDHLNSSSAEKLKDFFNEDASIVLISCSTGANQGIGQKLSEKFGLTVIAPNKDAHVSKIDTDQTQSGDLKFNVKYSVDTMEYKAGAQVNH
jgi:hypothetical protein